MMAVPTHAQRRWTFMSETTVDNPVRTQVIQLGLEDIQQAQRLHFWQFVRSRRGIFRIAVSSLRATALFALIVLLVGKAKSASSLILFFSLASPFIVLACSAAVISLLGKRLARKAFDQQKTLHVPYRVSWTDQGILIESEYGDARLPWGDLRKTRQDKNLILLYESDRLYRLIPTRCFTPAQLTDFQACMASVPRR